MARSTTSPTSAPPTAPRAGGRRETVAGLVALAVFVLLLARPAESLSPPAQRLAAVMSAVVILWITEALPLPVTALAGCAACVMLGVAPAKTVFAPFADPLMFLFIGSFILAKALEKHGLDRRLAYRVLAWRWVDARPSRVLLVYGAVAAGISGWISNTATTAMMFPIGLAVLSLVARDAASGSPTATRYATAMMLMTTFAASIGGLMTPIGTPTNLIGLGFLREELGIEIPFFQWMLLGAPVVAVMYAFLFVYLDVLCPAGTKQLEGGPAVLVRQWRMLGPWSTAEKSTCLAFLLTAALWVLPGIVALVWGVKHDYYVGLNRLIPEGVVALVGASLLFVLPGNQGQRAMTWSEAERIEWGVVLLYGGGLALGQLANETGLAQFLGEQLATLLPERKLIVLVAGATIVATLVSELTSNVASATIVVPLVIAIARAAEMNPAYPALAASMSSSLGFMLPVSTPCNAIVFSSRLIPLRDMMRYGFLLDLAGIATIITLVLLLGPWVLPS